MIKCNLLRFSFVWSFHNKIVRRFSLIFFGTAKQDYAMSNENKTNVELSTSNK